MPFCWTTGLTRQPIWISNEARASFPHLSPQKGKCFVDLPVWVRLWILRFSLLANTLPQPGNGHGKGFSPVWTRMWFTSLYLALKGRPLRQQPCQKQAWLVHSGPPTCSTVMWVTISCIELNNLLQVFFGLGWSTSTHMHDSSCLIGGRM